LSAKPVETPVDPFEFVERQHRTLTAQELRNGSEPRILLGAYPVHLETLTDGVPISFHPHRIWRTRLDLPPG
jgi:hypothetical protein